MRTSHLHHQLQTLLGQSNTWADRRHLQTFIWMVIGVICAECISLPKWAIYSRTRAGERSKSSTPLQPLATQSSHQCSQAVWPVDSNGTGSVGKLDPER
ncbi:MAG: hypothetical protein KME05_21735 [Gloeocapsa sp. UFS-A4-WI-NPMV-4B04]|nr:hypothetical protein [Gloeocapsa sp. UFS-A4-WI-NPMV-4B04]